MPELVKIACPHCESQLKLKDRSKLGQKLVCPKCKKPFKAEELVDDEDDFGGSDELEVEADDEDEDAAPRSRRTAKPSADDTKKKSKGRSRKKASDNSLPLIAGGSVALLLVIGIGLWLGGFFGNAQPAPVAGPVPVAIPDAVPAAVQPPVLPVVVPQTIDLSWLPAQSEAIVYLRPAELLKSPFTGWLLDTTGGRPDFNRGMEQMRQEWGLSIEEIESVTVGVKSLDQLSAIAARVNPLGLMGPLEMMVRELPALAPTEVVAVIRTVKPVDLSKILHLSQMSEVVTYNSAAYYRDKSWNGTAPSGFAYLPAPSLVVITGREDVLKGLIDKQGKAEPRPEVDMIKPDQHIAFASVMKPGFTKGMPSGGAGPTHSVATLETAQSGGIGIKVTEGVELTLWQNSLDPKAAEEIQGTMDGIFAQAMAEYQRDKSKWPTNLASITEALLSTAKTSRSERVVQTVVTLPASLREKLKLVPGEVMTAMLGGLGPQSQPEKLEEPGMKAPDVKVTTTETYATKSAAPRDSGGRSGAKSGGRFEDPLHPEGYQSEFVASKNLPGIPKGMTVRGSGGWIRNPPYLRDGVTLPPRLLTFDIELAGALAEKVDQYGLVQIKQAAIEPEQHLKLTDAPGERANVNASNMFADFTEMRINADTIGRRPGTVLVRLFFEHPAILPEKFKVIEGAVTLRHSIVTKEVLVRNIFDQAGKPTSNPDLKAIGFNMTKKTDGGKTVWNVKFSKESYIYKAELIEPNGRVAYKIPKEWNDEATSRILSIQPEGPVPPGLAMKIGVRSKALEATVPFKFENVPIAPSPEQDYVPGIPWRASSEQLNVPQVLAVDGRLRWSPLPSDKPVPPLLVLDIDVIGPPARNVSAFGFTKLVKATTNTGNELKLINWKPINDFFPLPRSPTDLHYPPNGIQVYFPLEQSEPFTMLEQARGKFKFLVGKERKWTTISNMASQIGKTVVSPDLQAAGLELKFVQTGDELAIQITKGNRYAISQFVVQNRTAGGGESVRDVNYETGSAEAILNLTGEKLTPSDRLMIDYLTDVSEIEVPFAFDKLPVPPMPVAK